MKTLKGYCFKLDRGIFLEIPPALRIESFSEVSIGFGLRFFFSPPTKIIKRLDTKQVVI